VRLPGPPVVSVPAIEFEGVVKRFSGVPVLAGLGLAVAPGEALALVGANGAGKTTCIKTLLDFVAADAGRVRIFGADHRRPRARAPLAFLPERFLPPFHLTGSEFLAHLARLHGRAPEPARARDAAAALDLDPQALSRPARSYSKGMAQKLGLLSCLLSDKELLVLDEPMSGLDPRARLLFKRRLAELRREGRTLFFTTHVLGDVQAVCDRMAVLEGGSLRFLGTPGELLDRYGGDDLEAAYLRCVDG